VDAVRTKKTTTTTGNALECLPLLLKSLLNEEITQNTVFVPETGRHNALSYTYVWHFRFEITSLPY